MSLVSIFKGRFHFRLTSLIVFKLFRGVNIFTASGHDVKQTDCMSPNLTKDAYNFMAKDKRKAMILLEIDTVILI